MRPTPADWFAQGYQDIQAGLDFPPKGVSERLAYRQGMSAGREPSAPPLPSHPRPMPVREQTTLVIDITEATNLFHKQRNTN